MAVTFRGAKDKMYEWMNDCIEYLFCVSTWLIDFVMKN